MANRSLGTLTLDLIAKTGGFSGPIDKAARDLDRQTKGMSKSLDGFASSLKTIGAGIAGFVSGAAIAGFTGLAIGIKQTVDSMDELSKSAQKVGITTEELSKLAYAGDLADVSLETLTSSLGKLTKAQAAALDTSSKTAEVFDALGIAVKNADGSLRSSSAVLGDFAQRFQELGGSPEAVAAGFQLFGRSFQELIPLLKDGREGIQAAGDELERFGGVVTTQAGQAAEEFNDNLTRLKTQFSAIFNQIAQQLLPVLVDLSEDLKDVAGNGSLASNAVTLISAALDVGVGALKLYNAAVDNVSIAIDQAVKSWEGWIEITKNVSTFGIAEGTVLEGINKIKDAANDAADARERLAGLRNAPASRAVEEGIDFTRGAPLSVDEQAAANKRLQTALGGVTTERQKATKATREQTQAEKDLLELEETYALIEEEAARFQTDRIIRDGEIAKQREEDFQQTLKDLEFEKSLLGQTADEQERLNLLRYAGVDAASEEGRVLEESLRDLQARREVIDDQVQAMDALREGFSGFLTDLKEGKSLTDSLKDAFDQVLDTIFQIVAQNLAESLFGQTGSTAGGAGGGWFSDLLGSFFSGGRATGGPVNAGGMYRVNENGTELLSVGGRDYLMMGTQSGTVTPAGEFGGVTISNTYVNPQMADPRSESQRQQRELENLRIATARNR